MSLSNIKEESDIGAFSIRELKAILAECCISTKGMIEKDELVIKTKEMWLKNKGKPQAKLIGIHDSNPSDNPWSLLPNKIWTSYDNPKAFAGLLSEENENLLTLAQRQYDRGDYNEAKQNYSLVFENLNSLEQAAPVGSKDWISNRFLKLGSLAMRAVCYCALKRYHSAIRDFSLCLDQGIIKPWVAKKASYIETFPAKCFISHRVSALEGRSNAYQCLGNFNSARADLNAIVQLSRDKGNLSCFPPGGVDSVMKLIFVHYHTTFETYRQNRIIAKGALSYKADIKLNIFDLNWVKIKAKNNVPDRQGCTGVYYNEKLFIVGGSQCHCPTDRVVDTFDLKKKKWLDPFKSKDFLFDLFDSRCVIHNDVIYLTGGKHVGKLWKLDLKNRPNVWVRVRVKGDLVDTKEGKCLPGFGSHSIALLGDVLYIFGGVGNIGDKEVENVNNLYSINLKTYRFKKLFGNDDQNPYETGLQLPEPRFDGGMWADDERNGFYLFGGNSIRPHIAGMPYLMFESNHYTLDDLWFYDVAKKEWTPLPKLGNYPCARSEFGCVQTSSGAMIFGGYSTNLETIYRGPDGATGEKYSYFGDTFLFDNATQSFRLIQTDSLGNRAQNVLINDGNDQIYSVFGYHGGPQELMEVYTDIHCMDVSEHVESQQKSIKECDYCGILDGQVNLKKCSGKCRGKAKYCSRECQKNDWKNHKVYCI